MRLLNFLFVGCVALALAAGCKSGGNPDATKEAEAEETMPMDVNADVVQDEPVAEHDAVAAPEPAAPQKPMVRRAPAVQKEKSRTVYVSSYDSKGMVWGHVTLTGDRGRGTIHDSEENTFSVDCERHGNELFATDQNGRQYVFKLEEN